MTWHILSHIEAHPQHLADPLDEWKKSWTGYVFASPEEYERFKEKPGGSRKVTGKRYVFGSGWEDDFSTEAFELRKCQKYVDELPGDGVDDIRAWVEEHAEEHNRDRFSKLYDSGLSDEAIAYFETHLVDDPHTVKMLEKLDWAIYRMRAYHLELVTWAATFLRALDLCEVDRAEDLPFELPEVTRNVINGSRTKRAMEEFCDGQEEREAAATLNMLDRKFQGKSSYTWTRKEVFDGIIHDDFRTLEGIY